MITFADVTVVNGTINKLPYKADTELYKTPEFWARIGPDGGDCEDFAIGKYRALLQRGCPILALRFAVCWVENGEYHAVLLVDLNDQTWVLDNRYPYPMEHQILPYRWHKLQIAGTNRWEKAKS